MSHVLEEETAKGFQEYFMQILLSQNHNLIPKNKPFENNTLRGTIDPTQCQL